jgi:hypothetical protein
MDLYKLGIKIYFANPQAIKARDCVPLFHKLIQGQKIAGHLLIDVHDYAHVQNGPGILLVAHEGNFSIDDTDGRPGVVYYRKQPLDGDVSQRLEAILRAVLEAARLIESEPTLKGWTIKRDELAVFSNDRLLAPNTAEARAAFEPLVARFAARAWPQADVRIEHGSGDPRERLTFALQSSKPL